VPVFAPFGRGSPLGTNARYSELGGDTKLANTQEVLKHIGGPTHDKRVFVTLDLVAQERVVVDNTAFVRLSSYERSNAGGMIGRDSQSLGIHCPTSSPVRTTYRRT